MKQAQEALAIIHKALASLKLTKDEHSQIDAYVKIINDNLEIKGDGSENRKSKKA